jgi:hypothetical protein
MTAADGPLGEVSIHLSQTLDRLLDRSTELRKKGSVIDLALFGPLLARGTLEVAATALLARYDPLRVLSIRKSQELSSYDPSSPNPIRFEWSSDVLGEKGKAWTDRVTAKDLQRSFLCNHVHDLIWEQAFQNLLDSVDIHRGGTWIRTLRRIEPAAFTSYMRTEASRLYSELSKGIHIEFVIPVQYQFDKATMGDIFDRVWTWVGNMGLTACHSKSLAAATQNPIDAYEEAQRELYT